MDDADSLESSLQELVEAAVTLLEGPRGQGMMRGAGLESTCVSLEVIEGARTVTALADLPGVVREEVAIEVDGLRLTIEAGGLRISADLPSRVDPGSLVKDCRNGVLSAVWRKAQSSKKGGA